MAIAFDATSYGQVNGTSVTVAHTCTGDDRVLVVGYYNNSGADDLITAMTYNGVAMTRVDGSAGAGSVFQALYILINPASGTNDIVVTTSGTVTSGLISASYTGCKQSGQPDAHGYSIVDCDPAEVSKSVTTVADNCWLVGFYKNGAYQSTVGAGFTNRYAPAYTSQRIGDSNGEITPAGSASMAVSSNNVASGTYQGLFVVSLAPVSLASPTNASFLYLMV